MRRARWKRKSVRDELSDGAANSPKTRGPPSRTAMQARNPPAGCAETRHLEWVRPRIWGHGTCRGAYLKGSSTSPVRSASLRTTRFHKQQKGSRRKPAQRLRWEEGRAMESAEAPPGADEARRIRGSTPVGRRKAAGNRQVQRCMRELLPQAEARDMEIARTRGSGNRRKGCPICTPRFYGAISTAYRARRSAHSARATQGKTGF